MDFISQNPVNPKFPELPCVLQPVTGAGKMAHQLVVPAALAEDLFLVSRIHMWLTTVCNFSSRGSNALFWLPWALGWRLFCVSELKHTEVILGFP